MLAVIPEETPDGVGQQHRKADHTDEIEQQNPGLQASELRRVRRALREHQQSTGADRRPQHYDGVAAPAFTFAAHIGSDHEYHSLTRYQSSVQNINARSDAGSRPRRIPARTLMR